MTQSLATLPTVSNRPETSVDDRPSIVPAHTARLVTGIVLIVCVPLFVCMPVTADVAMFDLQAQCVLDGGVAYRDILEPNLPGVVWIHMALRPFIGPSSEAIRLVDLVIVTAIVLLLARVLRTSGVTPGGQWTTALLLMLFYVSVTEWCHCQRDTWMLLPCLVAFGLRWRWVKRSAGAVTESSAFLSGTVEGCVWAAAFWIKPHVIVPATFCVLLSAILTRQWRTVAANAAGLLTGGLIVGAMGVTWLHDTGAWPWFHETLTEWNPRYVEAGRERWSLQRLALTIRRFHPWMLIHPVAIPLAILSVRSAIRESRRSGEHRPLALLSALYLGWLCQSFLIQHLMDYVHVPAVMLATSVVAANRWRVALSARRCALALTGLLVIAGSPLMRFDKLAVWNDCMTGGSTPAVRDALSDVSYPDWSEMEDVERFLKSQSVRNGDVTCHNVYTIHLYQSLGLQPSTRYAYLSCLLELFPECRDELLQHVRACGHRFVVTDLVECGLTHAEAAEPGANGPHSAPPGLAELSPTEYPWTNPVVFRSGRYLVHAMDTSEPHERRAAALVAGRSR